MRTTGLREPRDSGPTGKTSKVYIQGSIIIRFNANLEVFFFLFFGYLERSRIQLFLLGIGYVGWGGGIVMQIVHFRK